MTRARLIHEVNEYAERLVVEGNMNAFREVFGNDDPKFDVHNLSTSELRFIFENYIMED